MSVLLRFGAAKRLKGFAFRCVSTNTKDVQCGGDYDVIITGGGMVGGTMACAISKNPILSHLKILLLEGSQKMEFTLGKTYSNRVSALNQNTKCLMESIGAWKTIEDVRSRSVKDMYVWDACSNAFITFNEDNSEKEIAYIVENIVLLHGINEQLIAGGVDVLYGCNVRDVKLPRFEPGKKVSVKVQDGKEYKCKLLIGADGANSIVRNAISAQYLSWKYEQMGIVATLKLADETDNSIAWQRFLPTGPVALLPLDASHSSLVWSLPTEKAKDALKMSDQKFVDALNDALWKQYPKYGIVDSCLSAISSALNTPNSKQLPPCIAEVLPDSRAAFPLGFGHSTRYVDDSVALIGDAAHKVHPLAGQGVNLGFGDVACLVELLSNAVYSGESICEFSNLARYETLRQRHNVPMQFSIDALHRLYTTDSMPVVLVRSVGLQVVNSLLPLKKMLMDQARN